MIIAVKEAAYVVAKKKPEKKNQACCDSNLDLCNTRAALLKSGTMLYNYVCKECMECLKGMEKLTKQPVPFKSL